ncbi:hypothetical protein CGT92_08505 [Vibrio metoecus]|uniref:hypothetical protein n=1 Tax=Vibrio metoecus TaxID=1481663 RepID=UPI0006D76AE2|nr:hypothetical protein [Vibrio metoecus]KQB02682.1 hypothetical protein XV91_03225 [Vibrio metoecus]KQB05334.1 hypothetical protein XV93_13030 [Vibrio metoecus]PAR49495.1 hypothetical protein CGT94_13160 [Vibrio metoecus]PAR57682.1 hypothetical protein CGT92_08505 [Vibrio metoecus]PAR68436.1 hypothetical protein CGT91_06325 [Vibrio metoecus]
MNPIGAGAVQPLPSHQTVKYQAPAKPDTAPAPLKVEQNKVTLSEEGKALLAALQEIEKEGKTTENKDKTVGDKVESFTYGALGMEHPDKIKEEEDSSYSAGQYLSAAATIGGILLAVL